jgi:DNA-binding HxlR family transcriptional regulator
VERLLAVLDGEQRRDELQERLGLADRKYLRTRFLAPAIAAGLVEMKDPGSPRSRQQRYRLTDLGRRLRAELASRGPEGAKRNS